MYEIVKEISSNYEIPVESVVYEHPWLDKCKDQLKLLKKIMDCSDNHDFLDETSTTLRYYNTAKGTYVTYYICPR